MTTGRTAVTCEVAVIGGGPAGAAAALTLARAGRHVLLADATSPGPPRIGEALPPAARPLLRDLGVWDDFVSDGHVPCYGNLSAWGSAELNGTDFIYDPNGHGWHLDRARFDALLRGVARREGADVRAETTLKAIDRGRPGSWHLTLARGADRFEVQCRWVVDATGRSGAIARRQGARPRAIDALVGFFALFSPSDRPDPVDRDSRTLIEAVPDGWWYTALLPSGERVTAYLTDADLLMPRLPDTGTYLSLMRRTEHVRRHLEEYGYRIQARPKGIAAGSARLDRAGGDGWVAAGDAALALDPISSQGILNALYTGMEAARAVEAHLCGDVHAMEPYQARLETIYDAYLTNHSTFYAQETRWTDRRFWQRRRDRNLLTRTNA